MKIYFKKADCDSKTCSIKGRQNCKTQCCVFLEEIKKSGEKRPLKCDYIKDNYIITFAKKN